MFSVYRVVMMRLLQYFVLFLVFSVTLGFAFDQISPNRPQSIFKSINYYNVMFENSPVCQAFVSKDGEWVSVNDSLCRYLGYTQSELQKFTFQEITHPADVRDDVEMAERVANGDIEAYTMKKTYLGKYNTPLKAKLTVQGVYDEKGEFLHFYSIIEPLLSKNFAPAAYEESIPPLDIKVLRFFNDHWKTLMPWTLIIYLFAVKQGVRFKSVFDWVENKKKQEKKK